MDLKGMLNDGGAAAAAAGAPAAAPGKPAPSRPVSQHQHHQQQQQQLQQQQPPHHQPSTPIQTVPPHSFHDHPQSVQPSPVSRGMSLDYHPGGAHHMPFASPPPYGPAASTTPYAAPGRPPPPPLQPLSSNNVRSPSVGSAHVPASPYSRATPVGPPHRADSAGYPFPSPGGHSQHAEYASPVQTHRYPPSAGPGPPYPPQRGESYSQPSGPPMASPGPGGHPPGYFPPQPQHVVPQTPPVGTPVGAHPQQQQHHQRSASAQSQHAYPQPPYGSPIATNHPPPPSEHGRQPSQPATPLGPPMSTGPRQQQPTFAQPQSPYQHRVSSTGPPYPYPPQQPSPHVVPRPQPSPRPPIQRPPSVYDQAPPSQPHPQGSADPQRRSLSHSERERTVSVSPKTRVPSIPSSAGQASFSGPSGQQPSELDPRDPRSHSVQMRDAPALPAKLDREPTAVKTERASTPAKRKLDDRDIKPEDLDRQESRPPPFETNGQRPLSSSSRPPPSAVHHPSSSPMLPRRKPRHNAPPLWARPYDRQQLKNANFYLRKPGMTHTHVNGKSETPAAAPRPQERAPESRHVSPEASRASTTQQQAPPPNQVAPPPSGPEKPRMLGPWEATIANQAPLDEMCKTVADFLFMTVVNHSELSQLHGQFGNSFEIEAKLGALIDRNKTGNMRFQLPIESEAVLAGSISDYANFSSSMTEAQHKAYNGYLNSLVAEASPQNPRNKTSSIQRVPVNYVHLRETDRFYKLTEEAKDGFHPVLRNMLYNSRRDPSLRVTREQKTGQVVARIVKLKVADLHIMFPQCDLDCRITVNMEAHYEGSVEQLEQIPQDGAAARGGKPDRHKDRLSYTQGNYKVDLTQVTQPEAGGQAPIRKVHELEIELNADTVLDQGRRAMRGEQHNYDFLIEGFVNNIRLLARKAREIVPAQ